MKKGTRLPGQSAQHGCKYAFCKECVLFAKQCEHEIVLRGQPRRILTYDTSSNNVQTPCKQNANDLSNLSLEGLSTGDNLDELGCNLGLASAVEANGELLLHLGGVLGGVLHGVHTRRLLRGGALNEATIELGSKTELGQVEELLLSGLHLALVLVEGEGLLAGRLVVGLSVENSSKVGVGVDLSLVDNGRDEAVEDDVELIGLRVSLEETVDDEAGLVKVHGGLVELVDLAEDVVTVGADERARTLVTDDEDLGVKALGDILVDGGLGGLGDGRVDTTTETTVGANDNVEGVLDLTGNNNVLLGGLGVEDFAHGSAEWPAKVETLLVTAELGGTDHLHGGCDLTDVLGRGNTHLNLLEVLSEATSLDLAHGTANGKAARSSTTQHLASSSRCQTNKQRPPQPINSHKHTFEIVKRIHATDT